MTEIRRRTAVAVLDRADLHPVLRRVYAARGVGRSEELDLSLERLLPVLSLPGVEAAARLLLEHRCGRVLVIGDFDADGATSSALMVRALRGLKFAHVDFLVPDRFRLGYGLTPEIVALAAGREPSLIVTVDNGVSSIDGVAAANRLGLPVLITDHHLPGAVLPEAKAMVNPNLPDSTFGSAALAGVGVAFYVIAALSRLVTDVAFRPSDLLDLVALGTVADVVTLDHNNRILVAQGLRRIRAGRCVPGIRALLESGGRKLADVTAADLGFVAAPRLNAAGRLTDMSIGIACLLADADESALSLARQLGKLNEERREIEQRMQSDAVTIAAELRVNRMGDESLGLCLFDESWHQGVVGLVAGRIKDRLHRPVIAFARSETGGLRGSARSIPGVHIRDALDAIATRHPGLIEKFGGHAMAAGLSLAAGSLEAFRAAFATEIAQRVDNESLRDILNSDGELTRQDLSVTTARVLRSAGPWGQGFPEPVFDGRFAVLDTRIVGARHLKMVLRPLGTSGGTSAASASRVVSEASAARAERAAYSSSASGETLEAIAFGFVGGPAEDAALCPGAEAEIAYRLEINSYRGEERVQLNCQHVRCLSPHSAG
jgi:single-stranded-DNA-specific exonuclease